MLVILSFTADQLISNTSPSCPLFFFFWSVKYQKSSNSGDEKALELLPAGVLLRKLLLRWNKSASTCEQRDRNVCTKPPERRREKRGAAGGGEGSPLVVCSHKPSIWKPESALLEFLSGVHQHLALLDQWRSSWAEENMTSRLQFELTEGHKHVLHYFWKKPVFPVLLRTSFKSLGCSCRIRVPFYLRVDPSMISRQCK